MVVISGNLLSETFEIQCPNCSKWNFWQNWLSNWVDLPSETYGPKAKHIRAECPNCNQIYDHRNIKESDWIVRNLG